MPTEDRDQLHAWLRQIDERIDLLRRVVARHVALTRGLRPAPHGGKAAPAAARGAQSPQRWGRSAVK